MRVGAFAVWQDMRRTALFYSAAWGRVIFHKRLVGCVQSLVGPDVQWHHTLPPGAAVLWRTATWHCVGPNVSDKIGKSSTLATTTDGFVRRTTFSRTLNSLPEARRSGVSCSVRWPRAAIRWATTLIFTLRLNTG